MSPFAFLPPPWNIALSVAAMLVSCALVMDADWMAALVRGKDRAEPPALFRSPIAIPRGWLRVGYLTLLILAVAPLMMGGVTGIRGMMSGTATIAIVVAVIATMVFTWWADSRGWTIWSAIGGVAVMALLIAPYAIVGPMGWMRYGIVAGMMAAILLLLFLATQVHRVLLGYRPRTRTGAAIRAVLDGVLAIVVMVGTFWPWLD